MAFISKIILFLTAFVFFFGQLFRINFQNISFPIIDIFIFILFLVNIFDHFKNKDWKIKNKYFLYFLIFAWISFLINLFISHIYSLKPVLYLLRLTFLFSFLVIPLNRYFLSQKFHKFFNLIIISNIIFGLIQYLLWPDFTYFDSLNWDPHLFRLVGTFFDPTFTGLIFLLFLIKIFLCKKTNFQKFLIILSYFGLALTYSRSSLIAFLLAFSFIALKLKKPKIFFISLIIFLLTIVSLPRQIGEGTKLERTSSIKAKIENYKEGIGVFLKSPIIGHGYNNISFIRTNKNPDSHANSGFDSSLLTILVTTGIIGFILFILGLKFEFSKSNLVKQTMWISILFHSLFANSLLYPWILLFLIFI